MGMYDDHKYVQMMQEEFREPSANDMSWVEGIKSGQTTIDNPELIGDYKEYIRGLL